MSPSATSGRHSPSLQSIQEQKKVPQQDEGREAAEVAALPVAVGGENMLMARMPHASSRHETESEGIGSSVTSEDTITEDTLEEWSKEVQVTSCVV